MFDYSKMCFVDDIGKHNEGVGLLNRNTFGEKGEEAQFVFKDRPLNLINLRIGFG